jgi:hypothetical protein
MASGIPALLGKVAKVTNTASLLVADAKILLGMFAGPKWGIFNTDGSLAIKPDSMVSLDFKKEYKIPDYPQEQGSFQTYNKVTRPRDVRVRMTKGGSDSDRAQFIVQINHAANSLKLYKIAMPEGTVTDNMSILNYSFSRTATNGVGLLSVDMEFVEVLATATAAYSNTAAPSGADPVSTGSVQPQAPTTAQAAAASGSS